MVLMLHVVSRHERPVEGLAPCSHEEADTRMMLHVADAAKQYNTVIVRTVDSDVVVLAVYVFAQLMTSLNALWVAFGTGKNFRLIPAHEIHGASKLETLTQVYWSGVMTGKLNGFHLAPPHTFVAIFSNMQQSRRINVVEPPDEGIIGTTNL